MEFRISIEKKHLFFLTFVFLALASLIVVIAQPSTPNPGHAITQVPGAAPNCLEYPTSIGCATVSSQTGWGLKDVSAWSAESWNTNRLSGYAIGSFCRSDGSNCPFYKFPGDRVCQNSAFLCGFNSVGSPSVTPKLSGPFGPWTDQFNNPCDWVLCTLP